MLVYDESTDEWVESGGAVGGETGQTGLEEPAGSDSTSSVDISKFFAPYKSLFEKIKSGTAGANEYTAALGILGLLMPSLNKPQTGGWKGSVDLNKQMTRTPIAQPAYTPYAQSAAPVMGRRFFNTTYGAAPATGAAGGIGSADVGAGAGAGVVDTSNVSGGIQGAVDAEYKQSAGAAEGGLMGYARGGRAMPPRYLQGKTDGMADKIPSNIDGVQPAKLSHGEFVIPADVVSHLGNGNSDAGAKVLYDMMDRVRKARTGTKKQGRRINPEKFTPGGIAGYAGGGAVAFSDGGAAPPPPPAPLGATTETNIASWAGPYVGDMLSKTAALTSTPYQAYEGPLVAGTAPLQSKVFSGLEGLQFPGQLGQTFTAQGAYQLPTMTPGGVTGQGTGPTGVAAQYMNPYLSAVLTPQLEELRRQSQITQMGTAGKLAQAGAYGGSRQAIMDAETQRNLLAEQNKAIGTGYANAYDKAMGQFNTEQQQAKTLADMMAGAGQQQRGIEQEGITALQKQYETELIDPYTKLRFQKEMLSGLPVSTTATTANTSTMGQLKGGLADIQAMMSALGLG